MANTPEPASDRERQLQEILADFYEAEEAGRAPDRDELLARHPEFAAELRAFFDDHDRARHLAPGPGRAPENDESTTGPEGPRTADAAAETVRYFGDYELLDQLGEGGMGRVYKARQRSLKRLVALKMMKAGRFATEEDRRRFRFEAEAVATLDHANIVPIYEVGEHEGHDYFAMKLIEGDSLAQRAADWRLPAAQPNRPRPAAAQVRDRAGKIAELLATVARAVHYAHQRGILHRDLKPGNILLAGAVPHLTDFGLAKKTGDAGAPTLPGVILGTPSYMAPEQAEGRSRDVATFADVYSLGAILYELLTGRPPFKGETYQEVLRQVKTQEPVPPRKLNGCVPRDLETICLKCLEKEPGKRYASAEELARDLERYRGGEPIVARRVGPLERAWKWCRRNPRKVAAAAVGTALLVAVLGVVLWARGQQAAVEAETRRQAQTALEEAADLGGLARATDDPAGWARAVTAARRAETLLEGEVQDDTLRRQARARRAELEQSETAARQREDQRKKDRRMLERLEECRFLKTMMRGDGFDTTEAVAEYEKAFREYGIDPDKLTAPEAAARVKARTLRADLAAALDDWGLLCVDVKLKRWLRPKGEGLKVNADRAGWLFEAARTADDTDPWRNGLRAALTRPNLFTIQADLTKLARSADVVKVPPPSLALLGECLGNLGAPAEAVKFLRRAQEQHPDDPWVAYWLALHLTQQRPPDWDGAIRYWQAAYARRPKHAGMIFNIGWALDQKYDFAAAVTAYRKAIELRPDYPMAHQNLGITLACMYAWDEAAAAHQEAIRWRPKYAQAHVMLGLLRRFQGRYAEARDALQRSRELVGKKHPLWKQAEPLLKECEERLSVQARLPLLAAGDVQPRDAAEARLFGEVCFFREHYLAAARFYEGAPAAKANEADHYLAACAAARLGSGQGKDAAGLDEAERARWRGQALAWLTAELARVKKKREAPVLRQRAMARYELLQWKREPHLAGLRDMAALPEAEREASGRFWSEVDAALAAMGTR